MTPEEMEEKMLEIHNSLDEHKDEPRYTHISPAVFFEAAEHGITPEELIEDLTNG